MPATLCSAGIPSPLWEPHRPVARPPRLIKPAFETKEYRRFSDAGTRLRLIGLDGRFSHDAIIAPAQIHLSLEDRLALLRQLDRWRAWKSLDDKRLCLGCGRLFTGHDVEMRHSATQEAIELHCPTDNCQAIPLDWILPHPPERDASG